MGKLVGKVIAVLASYVSLLSAYFSLESLAVASQSWHILALFIAAITAGIFMFLEITEEFRNIPRKYKSDEKINAYMCRWISSGGRVAIFSRDMSWAREGKVREILRRKAENNELTICIETPFELTDDLKSRGADIIAYGSLGHRPDSRFTIVDFEKQGARVAVGVHDNGRHVIQEFRSGSHPFFSVAEDLVKFLVAVSKKA